jgi:hypothetical protein
LRLKAFDDDGAMALGYFSWPGDGDVSLLQSAPEARYMTERGENVFDVFDVFRI